MKSSRKSKKTQVSPKKTGRNFNIPSVFALADKHAAIAVKRIVDNGAYADSATECIISGKIFDAIKEYDVLSQSTGATEKLAPSSTQGAVR